MHNRTSVSCTHLLDESRSNGMLKVSRSEQYLLSTFLLANITLMRGAHPNLDSPSTNIEACTTRVRKTEVRTTPVRSQQCECQQCEGVNSANETRVRMSNVRMPAVRCDIGAKKVRQQCECQQCESHFFFSLILIGFGRNGKREPAKT